jgi:hypothetical protein
VSDRVVAVLARPSASLPEALAAAMLEDVVDLVASTPMVAAALAIATGYDVPPEIIWPGTLVVTVPADPTIVDVLEAVSESAAEVLEGTDAADPAALAIVVADVPDLPTLLLGKLFSALAGPRGAGVAISPAEAGGLVAVAANLPLTGWLAASSLRLDDPDAMVIARRAAPDRQLSICPGWHRVRTPSDVVHLDPGLDGWDATRTFLEAM